MAFASVEQYLQEAKPIIPTNYPGYQPPPPSPPVMSTQGFDPNNPTAPYWDSATAQWIDPGAYANAVASYGGQEAFDEAMRRNAAAMTQNYINPVTGQNDFQGWLGYDNNEFWTLAGIVGVPAALAGLGAIGAGAGNASIIPPAGTSGGMAGTGAIGTVPEAGYLAGGGYGGILGGATPPLVVPPITSGVPATASGSSIIPPAGVDGGMAGTGAAGTVPASTAGGGYGGIIPPVSTGAGVGSVVDAVTGAANSGAASGAANALGGAIPDWVGNYLMPGIQGLLGAYSANQATDAQTDAINAAIAEQRRQYDLNRADYAPYLQTGTQALGRLNSVYAGNAPNYEGFYASPDYQFRRSEGTRDIGNSFAARGGALSGNALKALTEFNSNLAAGEFGNWFNRQGALAGIGQAATGANAALGTGLSGNIAGGLAGMGDVRASGLLGRTSALSNAANDAIYNWLYRGRR